MAKTLQEKRRIGRPKIHAIERVQINFRCNPSLRDAINAAASDAGMSRDAWLTMVLEKKLAKRLDTIRSDG